MPAQRSIELEPCPEERDDHRELGEPFDQPGVLDRIEPVDSSAGAQAPPPPRPAPDRPLPARRRACAAGRARSRRQTRPAPRRAGRGRRRRPKKSPDRRRAGSPPTFPPWFGARAAPANTELGRKPLLKMAPAAVPDPLPTAPWSQSGLWPHPCHLIADPTEAAAPVPRPRSSRAESCVLRRLLKEGSRARHLKQPPRHGSSTRGGHSAGRRGDPHPRADPESTALPHVGTAGLGRLPQLTRRQPGEARLAVNNQTGRRRSAEAQLPAGRLGDSTSAPPLTGRNIPLTKRTRGRPCRRLRHLPGEWFDLQSPAAERHGPISPELSAAIGRPLPRCDASWSRAMPPTLGLGIRASRCSLAARPARMARRSPSFCSRASGSGRGRWDWVRVVVFVRGRPAVAAVAHPRHHRHGHRDAHAEQQQRGCLGLQLGRAHARRAQRQHGGPAQHQHPEEHGEEHLDVVADEMTGGRGHQVSLSGPEYPRGVYGETRQ